jgi:hypothetical protein
MRERRKFIWHPTTTARISARMPLRGDESVAKAGPMRQDRRARGREGERDVADMKLH